MALGDSLASTPSWTVASIAALLILLSLLMEHSLQLITRFVNKTKRKSLNQAVYQLKSVLRILGFISLTLSIANQPISKICISSSLSKTFLPCVVEETLSDRVAYTESEGSCTEGKVPLLSQEGTMQLQILILMLAVTHVTCSLLTLGLGEIPMRKWESWEQETNTLEHKLSTDNRRFRLARETSFGRRHLKFWSKNRLLLWIVCLQRQFTGSVSKADYFALRTGYMNAHLGMNSTFNFHKFLRRSLDEDFKVLVTISLPIWAFVMLFLFFSADEFYAQFWLPFIPLTVLLAVGAKLEAVISEMCLKGTKQTIIISGKVIVDPNDKLFWLGKPRWLLYAIQFILIENSFQLAFIMWDLHTFGYRSCIHGDLEDFSIFLGCGVLVQFLCAYVTLPLYALVSQMGSSMKKTIFADRVIEGLKHWHNLAKRNLHAKELMNASPSIASPSIMSPKSSSRLLVSQRSPSFSSRSRTGISSISPSSPSPRRQSRALPSPRAANSSLSESKEQSSSSVVFEFPTQWRELEEIQRVTSEIIGVGRNSSVGEVSFRMWWTQEMINSSRDGSGSRAELR